jgi:TonB family protein
MRVLIPVLFATAATMLAQAPLVGPHGETAIKVAVYAPKPDYPLEARKHHWTGVGWFAMHVDKSTGAVTSVDILQSTGHAILDQACVDALKKWKFIPNIATKVKTPIRFLMTANE